MPEEKWQIVTTEEGLVQAPEFVVEVLSPGNRQPEINHKIHAYLSSGIQEVLVVGLTGTLEFYRAAEMIELGRRKAQDCIVRARRHGSA